MFLFDFFLLFFLCLRWFVSGLMFYVAQVGGYRRVLGCFCWWF